MEPLILSRARIKRGAHAGTLASILLEKAREAKGRGDLSHRLIWSLFSETGCETRDFLFRETGEGAFLVLSRRPPVDRHALFDLESKPFAPVLAPGQTWRFLLRANAVVTRRDTDGKRKRHDVVMDRLHGSTVDRADRRAAAIRPAGLDWLVARGASHGFALAARPAREAEPADREDRVYEVDVDGYVPLVAPRAGRPGAMKLSLLDFEGKLVITDPIAFGAMLANGLGKGKGFGAGLMLIRAG